MSCKIKDAATALVMSECDPRTLGDCMKECLNPFNWARGKRQKWLCGLKMPPIPEVRIGSNIKPVEKTASAKRVKYFTKTGKDEAKEANAEKNGGTRACNNYNKPLRNVENEKGEPLIKHEYTTIRQFIRAGVEREVSRLYFAQGVIKIG